MKVLVLYKNNWGLGEYDPNTDTLVTPWGYKYNSPPLIKLYDPIVVKTGLLAKEYIELIGVFKDEKTMIEITSDGLKNIEIVNTILEQIYGTFKRATVEEPQTLTSWFIKNAAWVFVTIILFLAYLTKP